MIQDLIGGCFKCREALVSLVEVTDWYEELKY